MTQPGEQHAQATASLEALFKRHERVHLMFSGGKDSLVLMDLCRPWRDQLTLIWANTGIMWPHMVEFVRGHSREFNLIEVAPKQDFRALWSEQGLPADVIPVENALGRRWPKLQPWTSCCWTMRMQPLVDAAKAQGAKAVIHGQRAADRSLMNRPDSMRDAFPEAEMVGPIWEWSDDEIAQYVADRKINLPVQYGFQSSSLECAICPANPGVGDQRAAALLSPTLARSARTFGAIVRGAATSALAIIETEQAGLPLEDRPARWNAAEPLLAKALQYDDGRRSLPDIRKIFEFGGFELFTANQSALLIELIETPAGKVAHLYLAAGDLDDVTDLLRPQAEIFARMQGAIACVIGGRRGWIRAWTKHGYTFLQKSAGTHTWAASKSLASSNAI